MRHHLHTKLKITALLTLGLATLPVAATEITRGPYIQLGTDSSMIIRWDTDEPSTSQVHFGTQLNALNQTITSSELTTTHIVELDNLSPLTRYYYAVGDQDNVLSGDNSETFFETSPIQGSATPTRIWILGDPGRAGTDPTTDGQRIVRDGYYQYSKGAYTDFWMMLGDNAYNDGTIEEYQNAVFNQYPKMLKQSPLWPVMGNHDNRTAKVETGTGGYYDLFSMPKNAEAGGVASGQEAYFSFDYGNIHVVVLNSSDREHYELTGPMDEWLKEDLASTDAEWVIAVFHHPVYGKSGHDSDTEYNMIKMRENFSPILEEHGVDLVMSGHNHFYTRSTLINGHYGKSDSFRSSEHQINSGDGRLDGDGAYIKEAGAANSGTVYITHGSGSGGGSGYARVVTEDDITSGKRHPTDYIYGGRGSMVLDINDKVLTMNVIGPQGDLVDYFTISHSGDNNQPNELPIAIANGPYTGSSDEEISFSSDGSMDPDGQITSYSWYFGDGNTSSLANPKYAYTTAGKYTATLTVTDNHGAVSQTDVLVEVSGGADTVLEKGVVKTVSGKQREDSHFTFEVPNDASSVSIKTQGGTGDADLYVRIAQEPNLSDFDCRPYKAGNKEECIFAEAIAGIYHVMLRGYNDFSDVQLTADYQVDGNAAPLPDANGPYTAMINENIQFNSDGSYDPDGNISHYSWDFGDGSQSQDTNPVHQYASVGNYTAVLTVTDAQGKRNQDAANVTISSVEDVCSKGASPISGGRLEANKTYCLATTQENRQIQLSHLVRSEDAGKTIEIRVEHGTGNADMLHRFDDRPNSQSWDHSSSDNTNKELVIIPSASVGWHYIHVRANPEFAGAAISLQYKDN
ncbi:PKD domain-containing protein [uncultured Shewanella sp.]|uniref:PKD domain-containing protein n=1 Tax=uncultured Shewanella sp. TaxID=173975 RepID=UPI0026175B2A|nr:PKD domain-containing protein [uncultured Shewanella sp.]